MDQHLADQVASLLESTAALHRTLTHVVSQLPAHHSQLPSSSDLNLTTPASAQASILAPGVPIPSRGWQKNHSPRQRVVADTKARLEKDGWPDCEDTDVHAARLSEAMLRMGMEDMDNFATEATLVSAIVATFMSETYSNTESMHMQVVNGLWFLSLFLSLATATLCMLVSEWLTWSTSQELRDLSLLYRLIRTALRSLLMHLSIFLFFAGLLVLMWNESTMAVCVVPSVAVGLFTLYYVSATVRSPLFALLFDIKEFDDNDFRGLRVQIWTPFTLGTHHFINYIFIFGPQVLGPIPQRPELLRGDVLDSEKTLTLALETATVNKGVNAGQTLSPSSIRETSQPGSSQSKQQGSSQFKQQGTSQFKQRGSSPLRDRSPLSVCSQPPPGVESPDPQATSRVGTPLSMMSAADFVDPEVEHQRKLRATRLKRLTEFDILRPVRSTSARASDV
ncbi:unnamed protein product [Rhizoctonia solani]